MESRNQQEKDAKKGDVTVHDPSINKNMTTQEKLDALIREDGAEAVVAAIKGHVHPDGGTGCTKDSDCGKGYYCSNGVCVLNIG